MAFPGKRTDTIQNGASVSDGVEVAGYAASSLVLDGTYSNTSFDIQASFDQGTTWYDIYDVSGNKLNISVNDGKHALPADTFKDASHFRVSGSSNEAVERTIEWLIIKL